MFIDSHAQAVKLQNGSAMSLGQVYATIDQIVDDTISVGHYNVGVQRCHSTLVVHIGTQHWHLTFAFKHLSAHVIERPPDSVYGQA